MDTLTSVQNRCLKVEHRKKSLNLMPWRLCLIKSALGIDIGCGESLWSIVNCYCCCVMYSCWYFYLQLLYNFHDNDDFTTENTPLRLSSVIRWYLVKYIISRHRHPLLCFQHCETGIDWMHKNNWGMTFIIPFAFICIHRVSLWRFYDHRIIICSANIFRLICLIRFCKSLTFRFLCNRWNI